MRKPRNPEYQRKVHAAQQHAQNIQDRGQSLHSEIQSLRRLDADPVFIAELERIERRQGMHANAKWATAYKDSLPDSAFFYVDKSCVRRKDAQGRSHPLNCRHFPYKDRSGKISLSHVRNAISRAPQSSLPLKVQRQVQADARKVLVYGISLEGSSRRRMSANVSIRIPNMPRWKQISGDMDPGKYGAVIARSDGDALELVEIQPVREYVGDGEAGEVGFPFWSKEAYYDLDDLSPSREDVQHALQSAGMEDLEGGTGAAGDPVLSPEDRALIIAEALIRYGTGVDEGPAGWSSDVVPGEVEWWRGVAGAEFIADEDDEFRRDILGEDDEDEEFESNSGRVTKKTIPKSEIGAWQYGLRHHKGQKGPHGIPFGKRIQYQGSSWLVYDFDADATAPGGVTLVLVAPDFTESVRGVEVSHAMHRNPGRSSTPASSAGGRGPNPERFDTELDEMVYGIVASAGSDEETGGYARGGTVALLRRHGADILQDLHDKPPGFAPRPVTRDERDFLMDEGSAGVIVFITSAGVVQVVYYNNDQELEEDWAKAIEELGGLAENPTRGVRGEQAARAKFDKLRQRYIAAREKVDALQLSLGARYGHARGWESWLKATEKSKLERAKAAADREYNKMLDYIESISPRDWSYGVPAHWVAEKLSYEDAVRPENEPLSVVPPLGYGATVPRQ